MIFSLYALIAIKMQSEISLDIRYYLSNFPLPPLLGAFFIHLGEPILKVHVGELRIKMGVSLGSITSL